MTVAQQFPPGVFGHRGAPRLALENSLASFLAARHLGADGVELDVRRTADGVLVVHHDALTPAGQVIVDVVAADLDPAVARLDTVLDAVSGMSLVNVEIKDLPGEPGHDPSSSTAAAVADHLAGRADLGAVVVSSFDTAALVTVRERLPEVAIGVLTVSGRAPAGIGVAADLGASWLHPAESDVDAGLVGAAAAAGLRLSTWTVNDPGRARELARLGVDGIITDVPDLLLAALGRR